MSNTLTNNAVSRKFNNSEIPCHSTKRKTFTGVIVSLFLSERENKWGHSKSAFAQNYPYLIHPPTCLFLFFLSTSFFLPTMSTFFISAFPVILSVRRQSKTKLLMLLPKTQCGAAKLLILSVKPQSNSKTSNTFSRNAKSTKTVHTFSK